MTALAACRREILPGAAGLCCGAAHIAWSMREAVNLAQRVKNQRIFSFGAALEEAGVEHLGQGVAGVYGGLGREIEGVNAATAAG
jgi:hypothetical protein